MFPSNANTAAHMMLEELGLNYELELLDRARNAQKSRELLARGGLYTPDHPSLVQLRTALQQQRNA